MESMKCFRCFVIYSGISPQKRDLLEDSMRYKETIGLVFLQEDECIAAFGEIPDDCHVTLSAVQHAEEFVKNSTDTESSKSVKQLLTYYNLKKKLRENTAGMQI